MTNETNPHMVLSHELLREAAVLDARSGLLQDGAIFRLIPGEGHEPAPAVLVAVVERITGRDLDEGLHLFARPNLARCRSELRRFGMRSFNEERRLHGDVEEKGQPTDGPPALAPQPPERAPFDAIPAHWFDHMVLWVEHNRPDGSRCDFSGQLHEPAARNRECPQGCPASRPLEGPEWMVTRPCGRERPHRGHSWLSGPPEGLEVAWCADNRATRRGGI